MKLINSFTLSAVVALLTAGCATGEQYKASTFQADELNQRQEARTVKIIALLPTKVEVENREAKKMATTAGALLGAISGALLGSIESSDDALIGGAAGGVTGGVAGSMVSDKVLVNGVSITYSEHNKIYTSTEVGEMCEFKNGTALVIITKDKETRIQPNATCTSS